MSFGAAEVEAFVRDLPQGALCGAEVAAQIKWCEFLLSVDESPKAHHDLFWYLSVGKLLAEKLGTLSQLDIGDSCMREIIGNTVRHGEKPYTSEVETSVFQAWVVQPTQVAFAYRVQRKCATVVPQAPTPESTLAGTMNAYLEARAANKRSVKALCSQAHRAGDGQENLAVFEAAGRIAREKGRLYVGSADGEDLQNNFRPAWSRIPRIDVPRQMAELKRVRATSELDYPGYATFHAHIMDWGLKLILMKTATPLEILGYSMLLSKIAEEEGGVRTAYQYDVMARLAMAKALERGDPDWNLQLTKAEADLAKQAKRKVEARAAEAARALAGKGAGKGKHGKGDAFSAKGSERSSGSAAARPPPRSLSPAVPPRSRSPLRNQDGWHHSNDQGSWKQKGWQQRRK
ncbi:unnamed protein product [Prorocentrum cordatum]|uniref:Uncharacterized protein n=1 Tax=Prorocentrum cordatum TaxID=2364126 RepID=A0ABN9USD5_9DINO|nr:unnamed protein product [Polarella glacialis]